VVGFVFAYITSVPCIEWSAEREFAVVVWPTAMNEMGPLFTVASKVELRSLVVRPRLVSTMIIVGTMPYDEKLEDELRELGY
jgi:hypothetical protein